MTRPDLDALEVLLAKATPGPWSAGEPILGVPRFIVADCGPTGKVYPATNEVSHGTTSMDDAALIVAAINALPALIARVRKLEQERDAAALAMRERCAQACEELSVDWFPRDKHDAAREGAIMRCAAAIRALEP